MDGAIREVEKVWVVGGLRIEGLRCVCPASRPGHTIHSSQPVHQKNVGLAGIGKLPAGGQDRPSSRLRHAAWNSPPVSLQSLAGTKKLKPNPRVCHRQITLNSNLGKFGKASISALVGLHPKPRCLRQPGLLESHNSSQDAAAMQAEGGGDDGEPAGASACSGNAMGSQVGTVLTRTDSWQHSASPRACRTQVLLGALDRTAPAHWFVADCCSLTLHARRVSTARVGET